VQKVVFIFSLVTALSIAGLSGSCANVQYSENARKILPATVRIIAGENMGSGVVVGKSGLVLTSNHVIADSKLVEVFFVNGTKYQGQALLNDAVKDLALIQLQASGAQFPYANLGSSVESDGLQTGDNLEIIGYPAYTGSDAPVVSNGRISGFPRIQSVQFIQTCASVYPGNSGGPVINRFGEVIGIVNGKYTNISDRCATFATAISEADDLIARVHDRGLLNTGADKHQPAVTQSVCPNVGCKAPDFTLSALNGQPATLQSLKGRKVVLIFSGDDYLADTRLVECVAKVYEAWPRGQLEAMLVIPRGNNSDLADWVKANGIKFPVLLDPNGEITNLYNAAGFPAFYFINAYGDIKIKRADALGLCYEEIDALLRLY